MLLFLRSRTEELGFPSDAAAAAGLFHLHASNLSDGVLTATADAANSSANNSGASGSVAASLTREEKEAILRQFENQVKYAKTPVSKI